MHKQWVDTLLAHQHESPSTRRFSATGTAANAAASVLIQCRWPHTPSNKLADPIYPKEAVSWADRMFMCQAAGHSRADGNAAAVPPQRRKHLSALFHAPPPHVMAARGVRGILACRWSEVLPFAIDRSYSGERAGRCGFVAIMWGKAGKVWSMLDPDGDRWGTCGKLK